MKSRVSCLEENKKLFQMKLKFTYKREGEWIDLFGQERNTDMLCFYNLNTNDQGIIYY